MSESADEGLPNLEVKLGNMIDELIETDEDLEKNGLNSFYFSDELCESKYKKLFEKENPNNSNINNSQLVTNPQMNKSINIPQNIMPNQITFLQNNPMNISTINYTNNYYPPNFYPFMIPQQINNPLNHSSIYSLNNSSMNTTTSFSNYEKSLDNNMTNNLIFNQNLLFNKNNIIYPNYNNNSFCGDIEKNNFLIQNPQFHNNSFINNNIINNNNGKNKKRKTNQNISINITNNKKNNLFNANAELEMLLIQVKKILIKIQKIDNSVYSKCKGNFEQIIRTHKGSRIFQNYLKNTHYDILHLIFSEIKNKLTELLKDSYSNYFCKKLFRNLSQKDRIEYLTIIQPELNILSKDSIATYPIQNIIEELGSKNEKSIFYLGIKNYIDNFAYNIYGARILEKILAYFEDEFKKEIIEYICENFLELAYNNNGICLVKKILLMTHKKDLHIKLKKLVFDNALNLIVHQYGNYAIQIIIENWDETDLKEILEIYENKYIFLSNQKFSSNVMERILEKSEKNLENYINEISKGYNLNELLKNKYGNFVIKKAYDLANGNLKKKLGESINKNLKLLDNTKIVNKWKGKLIQNNSI